MSVAVPEARYRELFEGALLGIYVSHPDGRLLACNDAFARMLGFGSVADAIGASMATLYDNAAERDAFVKSVRERGRLEYNRVRLRRRDGRCIDAIETVVGEFDAAGALVELRGFLLDVTESVAEQARLLERDRQFRSVFFDASDAMLILDDDRSIVESNPAACALFRCGFGNGTRETGCQMRLDALIADEGDRLERTWRELLALGEARSEHRVRGGGGTRMIECSYRARVHGGRHLCIARDVTDRRLLEERLAQSEKIESVGRLAGGIAHDFNNLLTAILGYTELLLVGRDANAPDRADLEEIQKAGIRAAALTQQLLAFSRKQVLRPKDVDLNHTVAGLQGMLTRLIREDIRLTCTLAPTPAVVAIDPTQIEQVLLNLVLNARDAMPGGGEIRIDVACMPRSQVDLPPELQATAVDYVRLRVADTGIGLSPEARAHLFEPFYTTKEIGKGTGLGLASAYGIVRQSNGFISVDSTPGRGTVFTMHFPAAPAEPAPDAPAATLAVDDDGRETILLVEDEDAVRAIVTSVLRRHGYRVLEAATPRLARELFDRCAGEIDLLVADVVMPEMNGPALAQLLVGVRPQLRVLFISGYTDMAVPVVGENVNIGFLSKPFQASALIAKVRDMLAGRDVRPERMKKR